MENKEKSELLSEDLDFQFEDLSGNLSEDPSEDPSEGLATDSEDRG